MENLVFIIILTIVILIFAKKFFFAKHESSIETTHFKQHEEKVQEEDDDEVFYIFNVTPIKLSLYDSRIFTDFYIATAYKTIVVDHLWRNEPFLTNFSKILYFIDSNNFWIKSPKTKSIVMHLRGLDGGESNSTSLKVLSIKEVVGHTVLDIFKNIYGLIEKKSVQNTLLNSLLFVLIQSDNLQDFLGDNFSKSHDEILIYESLISFFFENSSEDFKINLLKLWKSHHSLISKIYLQNIHYSQEYAYTTSQHKNNDNVLLRLGNMPKKQLLSIK